VAKKIETWTPERVSELLNAPGTQTPSGAGEFDQGQTPARAVAAKFDESTKQQITFYRDKMKAGGLSPREVRAIRALATSNPGAFSDEELKAAGIPLPPKKK
jgi:hypothetical protein